ncbi:unnamed protein product [Prorocentrum cordatum]|uniref:RRM domain-containing protein n=1 Tax=Prorocentrum cordatum TaxID=2364126 RepID=A0ABN9SFP3_9DINO|nr:unnamed protein product [Polarella glacialis]
MKSAPRMPSQDPSHTHAEGPVRMTLPWRVRNTFVEVGGGDGEAWPDRLPGRTARSCPARAQRSSSLAEPAGKAREGGAPRGGVLAAPAVAVAAAAGDRAAASAAAARPEAEEAGAGQEAAGAGGACRKQREEGRCGAFEEVGHGRRTCQPPRGVLTIGGQLKLLQREQSQCVFVARRLNTLGFASDALLTAHFSAFGQVRRVLVAHSQVKRSRGDSGEPAARVRPGSIGFVVMVDAGAVARILQAGSQQVVAGKRIAVEPFQHAPPEGSCGCAADEALREPMSLEQICGSAVQGCPRPAPILGCSQWSVASSEARRAYGGE